MANNPYVNKVVYGDTTLIDISDTTATAAQILEGYTAYGADGEKMTGTALESNLQTKTKSYTPTETVQSETISPDSGYNGLESIDISVGAISPTYVGSEIDRRSSSDLTASGAAVTVPAGYYENQASKSVASGSAGTPTATKGTVSNHAISVTPSVTNTTGYITGGTKTGAAVSVSASELVSGATSISSNGTYDVTNYATARVSVPSSGGMGIGTDSIVNPSSTAKSLEFIVPGEPSAFALRLTDTLSRSSSYSYYYITAIVYDGSNTVGNYWRMSTGIFYSETIDSSHYSFTYNSLRQILTISTSSSRSSAGGSFFNGTYELLYVY